MKPFRLSLIGCCIVLVFSSCAKHPIHPGTGNQFDSDVYDAIMLAHQGIEDTKKALAEGKFAPPLDAKVKMAVNILVIAYNDADIVYCNPPPNATPVTQCAPDSYHALALAGTVTTAQTAAMNNKMTALTTATSELTAVKGGK